MTLPARMLATTTTLATTAMKITETAEDGTTGGLLVLGGFSGMVYTMRFS